MTPNSPKPPIPIPLHEIAESPSQYRLHYNTVKLQELADSIKSYGVLQPVLVRPIETGYELVYGHRRFRACAMAGLLEINAEVQQLTDSEAREIQLTENIQREDPHPLEDCVAYQAIIESGDYGTGTKAAKALAQRIGKSVRHVYDRLAYNKLSETVRKLWLEGEFNISATHAVLLSRLTHEQQQLAIEAMAEDAEYPWTVEQLQEYINDEVLLKLDSAEFDLADPDLCADAGSCLNCEKNTAVGDLLFPDSAEAKLGMCIDRECHGRKVLAWEHRKIEELTAKHGQKPLLIAPGYSSEREGVLTKDHYRIAAPDAPGAIPAVFVEGRDRFMECYVKLPEPEVEHAPTFRPPAPQESKPTTPNAPVLSTSAQSPPPPIVNAEGLTPEQIRNQQRREELRMQKVETLSRKRIFDAVLQDFEGSAAFVERVSTSIDVLRAVALHMAVRGEHDWTVYNEPVNHPGRDIAKDALDIVKDRWSNRVGRYDLTQHHFDELKCGLKDTWKAIFISATTPEILVYDGRKNQPCFVLNTFAKLANIDTAKIRKDADWELLSKKAKAERLKIEAANKNAEEKASDPGQLAVGDVIVTDYFTGPYEILAISKHDAGLSLSMRDWGSKKKQGDSWINGVQLREGGGWITGTTNRIYRVPATATRTLEAKNVSSYDQEKLLLLSHGELVRYKEVERTIVLIQAKKQLHPEPIIWDLYLADPSQVDTVELVTATRSDGHWLADSEGWSITASRNDVQVEREGEPAAQAEASTIEPPAELPLAQAEESPLWKFTAANVHRPYIIELGSTFEDNGYWFARGTKTVYGRATTQEQLDMFDAHEAFGGSDPAPKTLFRDAGGQVWAVCRTLMEHEEKRICAVWLAEVVTVDEFKEEGIELDLPVAGDPPKAYFFAIGEDYENQDEWMCTGTQLQLRLVGEEALDEGGQAEVAVIEPQAEAPSAPHDLHAFYLAPGQYKVSTSTDAESLATLLSYKTEHNGSRWRFKLTLPGHTLDGREGDGLHTKKEALTAIHGLLFVAPETPAEAVKLEREMICSECWEVLEGNTDAWRPESTCACTECGRERECCSPADEAPAESDGNQGETGLGQPAEVPAAEPELLDALTASVEAAKAKKNGHTPIKETVELDSRPGVFLVVGQAFKAEGELFTTTRPRVMETAHAAEASGTIGSKNKDKPGTVRRLLDFHEEGFFVVIGSPGEQGPIDLLAVIPRERWTGKLDPETIEYEKSKRVYRGGLFTCKGLEYVCTGERRTLTLVQSPAQLEKETVGA